MAIVSFWCKSLALFYCDYWKEYKIALNHVKEKLTLVHEWIDSYALGYHEKDVKGYPFSSSKIQNEMHTQKREKY